MAGFACKSKSPLPPFFKRGMRLRSSFPAKTTHSRACLSALAMMERLQARLSSPFEKGGLRGICLSLLVSLSLAAPIACAQSVGDPAPLQFQDPAEEARFHALTSELRCVMCQNQSLADSNAQIAHDLRREVLKLMREGKSDDEVVAFLVQRYGEFVRYKPAMEPSTWLLWFGPALLLLGGGIVILRLVRARARRDISLPDDGQEW
jgi:cytochrome c-type biogenesis protein CcmH